MSVDTPPETDERDDIRALVEDLTERVAQLEAENEALRERVDELDALESGAVFVGLVLTAGIAFIPLIRDIVYANNIAGLAAIGVLYSAFAVFAIK